MNRRCVMPLVDRLIETKAMLMELAVRSDLRRAHRYAGTVELNSNATVLRPALGHSWRRGSL